jgi:hypothetical protein
MSNVWIDTIGTDPEALVSGLMSKGIAKYDALRLINNLVAVNLGQSPRHFTFSSPLPTSTPAPCAPTFARTFSHQDWVDGESTVQAGESADDKGFNWRFNAITADLDALHRDTQNLFECLSTLRAQLVQALQDVAAELNRIDADLGGLSERVQPKTQWQTFVDAPQFLGVRDLDGSKVTMWKTGQNVVVLPGVDTVALQDTVAQRVATGGQVAQYATENVQFGKDVQAGQTVQSLIDKYGGQRVADGRTVAQALSVLPLTSTYTDAAALVTAVNTQEQAFLRSTVGSVDAVGAVVGVTSTGAPLSTASAYAVVSGVVGAPAVTGTETAAGSRATLNAGLNAAGFTTVADISGKTASQVVTALGKQGISVTDAQATNIIAQASMIAGFGG